MTINQDHFKWLIWIEQHFESNYRKSFAIFASMLHHFHFWLKFYSACCVRYEYNTTRVQCIFVLVISKAPKSNDTINIVSTSSINGKNKTANNEHFPLSPPLPLPSSSAVTSKGAQVQIHWHYDKLKLCKHYNIIHSRVWLVSWHFPLSFRVYVSAKCFGCTLFVYSFFVFSLFIRWAFLVRAAPAHYLLFVLL